MDYPPNVAIGCVIDLVARRLHRQHHIGARIAIGNRKNVQQIDHLLIGAQPSEPSLNQFLENLPIYRLFAKFLARLD